MANKNIHRYKISTCIFSVTTILVYLPTTSYSQYSQKYSAINTPAPSPWMNKRTTTSQNDVENKYGIHNSINNAWDKNKAKNNTFLTTGFPTISSNNGFKNGSNHGTSGHQTTTDSNGESYFKPNNNIPRVDNSRDSDSDSTSNEKPTLSMIGVIGKKEFYHMDENMRFGGAMEFCASHNMSLAAIESQFENNLVKNYYDSLGNHKHGWLGATDAFSKKGEFLWFKDREPLSFTSWADGYPKDEDAASCINFNDGEWQNLSCDYFETGDVSSFIRPICQKDI